MIPYVKQSITEQDIASVTSALRGEWVAGGGPLTERFERKLCDITGYKHAVVVSSGAAALFLAMKGYYLGARMTVPALTFCATVNAIEDVDGCEPVFVDVNEHTLVAEANVSVAYAGYPILLNESHNNVNVVEVLDAAHWFIPNIRKYAGGQVVCLSFHAQKPVTTGEGGCILTDYTDIVEHVKILRDHGRYQGLSTRVSGNYRLSGIQCALGISQLDRLEEGNLRRRGIAQYYTSRFQNCDAMILPASHILHSWHLYVIRLVSDKLNLDRDQFREELKKRGIGTQIHYYPVHRQPYYREKYGNINLPNTMNAWKQMVSIPMYAGLKDEEVEFVADTILNVIEEHRQ